MRLKVGRAQAQELLTDALNQGYQLLSAMKNDFTPKWESKTFDSKADNDQYEGWMNGWGVTVRNALNSIFPTDYEWNKVLNPPTPGLRTTSVDQRFTQLRDRMNDLLGQLRIVMETDLSRYTDLPQKARLYVQDIDSFARVRDVNVSEVRRFLSESGYLNIPEDEVQIAIEQIIDEPFHKKDWGGEINDLYSSQVRVNGRRVSTAFMLKGNGLRKPVMELADCGKQGDQIVRLFRSPADLFIVQFVGNVSESVIADIDGKVNERRLNGEASNYCVMNGLDTACVLYAYGKLK